jgi:hypothetical protein
LAENRFLYMNRELTREQLRSEVEAEATGLDPEQWFNGVFEFDEWLSDSIVTGSVARVESEHLLRHPLHVVGHD